jgi:hypothetical protein
MFSWAVAALWQPGVAQLAVKMGCMGNYLGGFAAHLSIVAL